MKAAVIGLFTFFSATGLAQGTDNEPANPIPFFNFIGNGCPTDSDSVDYYWEGATMVVRFRDMVAEKGAGISLTKSRRTCSITVNLKVPEGLTYTLAGYSAFGSEDLAADDTRNVTLTNFFQGQGENRILQDEVLGPQDGSFSAQHWNIPSENLWSPCYAQRAQTITASIRIGNGGDRAAASRAVLETLRLPFRLGLCARS